MRILMVGTGYVGLVTGACFSEMGHSVVCLDIDEKKIARLKEGHIPIYEPGLAEIVKRNHEQGRLSFTSDYKASVPNAQICFIAVPTPSREDGSCDTSFVEMAALQLAEQMNEYKIIVNKSTVPVGTAHKMSRAIQERYPKLSFDILSNPEFLKEGAAVQDCLKPDRIIIGADNPKAAEALKGVYAPFEICQEKVLLMDTLSAEMTKYAANAMLAARISFMNEIAEICKEVGANITEVRKGIGSDSRIGPRFLYAGIGYGGSCFPKDIRALISIAKQAKINPSLLQAVDEVNIRQKKILAEKVRHYFAPQGGVKGKTIAVWGLSFKPDTDDMREAPSLIFIEELVRQGAHLRLFDPIAMPNAQKLLHHLKNIHWCKDEFEAAENADAIALLTEWKQFRLVDFKQIKLKQKVLFDGRNQYRPPDMKSKGFDYISIGAPDVIRK